MESLNSGTNGMTLVRLRERAQITLPQEVRDALKVKQGDYLEAEVVEGGVRSALAGCHVRSCGSALRSADPSRLTLSSAKCRQIGATRCGLIDTTIRIGAFISSIRQIVE